MELEALGDSTRRAILERLLKGPLAVAEIADGFAISRPAISQHLKILKDAQLVIDRPDGNRNVYSINPRGFASLKAFVDQFASMPAEPEPQSPPAEEGEDNSWRTW